MYCPNCRTVVPYGKKFCPECGTQIYQPASNAQGQQQPDANYAQEKPSKASIFTQPVELKRSKKAEEKKKSITQKPWFIIVLIIIIAAAVKSRGANSTSRSSSNDRTTSVVATEAHTAVTRAVPKESTESKTTEVSACGKLRQQKKSRKWKLPLQVIPFWIKVSYVPRSKKRLTVMKNLSIRIAHSWKAMTQTMRLSLRRTLLFFRTKLK